MGTVSYRIALSERAELVVWFITEREQVVSYAVVLVVEHEGERRTVRVYDNAHGQNEMHRHTLTGGKQPAEVFQAGSYGESMRAGREEILTSYERMIEAWRR